MSKIYILRNDYYWDIIILLFKNNIFYYVLAIPAVSNLRAIINEDFLTVNWDPAFRANECNISYSIKYDNDEVFEQNSSLPSATLNVTFVPCYQASLEVSPISSTGLVGLSSFTLLQPRMYLIIFYYTLCVKLNQPLFYFLAFLFVSWF